MVQRRPAQLFGNDPVKSLLLAQNLGSLKPSGPVYISTNRWDSFNPYQASVDVANQWCSLGGDVQLWTNEEPPFLNKAGINTLLPYFVDGERSMQWLSDRFKRTADVPQLRARGLERLTATGIDTRTAAPLSLERRRIPS